MNIKLDQTSRFINTPVFSIANKTVFGLWRQPTIKLDGDEPSEVVNKAEEGELDHMSFRNYGKRDYWWAIAVVNGISNVTEEVVAGMVLTIPKLERITETLVK